MEEEGNIVGEGRGRGEVGRGRGQVGMVTGDSGSRARGILGARGRGLVGESFLLTDEPRRYAVVGWSVQ